MKNIICAALAILAACHPNEWLASTVKQSPDKAAISLSMEISQNMAENGEIGSLVLEGTCGPNGSIRDTLQGPLPEARSAKDYLHRISQTNPRLAIYRDDKGFWRIVDHTASQAFLDLKIANLTVRSYGANDAVSQIFRSGEVKQFLKEHSAKTGPSFGGLAPVDPADLRHDVIRIKDQSIKDALDQIVRKYHGVWLYRECRQANGQLSVDVHVAQ